MITGKAIPPSSSMPKFVTLALAIAFAAAAPALAVGTWIPLTHQPPDTVQLMLLLTDGTVIAANNNTSNAWYRLTPDINGSYINGTWTTIAPMNDTRLYYSSDVLRDGRVFVAGGEYGTGAAKSEVYNPLTNTWTPVPVPTSLLNPAAGNAFVDSNSKMIANGNVLVSPVEPLTPGQTLIFNASSNTWAAGPTLFRGTFQDEASWVKLPDDSILTIDPFGTNSERYIPATNTWINDGVVPVSLYDPFGEELGAAFLLANGKAFFLGSTGHTALYTPSGTTAPGVWIAGPDIPAAHGTPDAPAAMMVNGKILCAVSPLPTSGNHFPTPTSFYEYDPVANAFTSITGPTGQTDNISSYQCAMLVLPDGNVLFAHTLNTQLYAYHPDGTPLPLGKPAISSIAANGDGSYHLTGTGFNGISEGAAYGDDFQMDTNYPLVRLTRDSNVYYARTYAWSRTSVQTGSALVSTEFRIPPSVPTGTYQLSVVVNGYTSDPIIIGDCNTNNTPDDMDVSSGHSRDCNTNGVPDECEPDCNTNGTADRCDIASGQSSDCNTNFIPDSCEAAGLGDLNHNGVPDLCEDCNSDGTPDIGQNLPNCNTNGLPDTCDIAFGLSSDCDTNRTPDDCQPDCNTNHTADVCDIADHNLLDSDGDAIPDICDNCANLSNADQNPWLDHTVQSPAGQYGSLAVAPDGHVGLSYYRSATGATGFLRFWNDANTDLVPQPSELITIDTSAANVGRFTSLTFDSSNRAMIAYFDVTNGDLKFWYDSNLNNAPDAGEISAIDTSFTTGQFASLKLDSQDRPTVAFTRVTNTALRVWHDANSNHVADAGEVVTIDGFDGTTNTFSAGSYCSLTFSPSGQAVVAYYQTINTAIHNLRLWVDANTNFAPDPGELVTLDSGNDLGQYTSIAFDPAGHAAVAYYDHGNGHLKVWHDTNGNYQADAGEITVIDGTTNANNGTHGDVGSYASLIFDPSGNAMVAYYDASNADLKVWRDSNANFQADPGEITRVRTTGNVGSFATMIFHPTHFAPLIAYRDDTNASMNFTADLDWDGDGFCFTNDNCPGAFNPTQADSDSNGIGDACEGAVFTCGDRNKGDLNGDQSINTADVPAFVAVLLSPNDTPTNQRCAADLNNDGLTDGKDVSLFVQMIVH